ncbi:DUF397 domain-containing protein [Actinomadura parmotrematis]|uniref:DUF397 domain-containing protein n=1 Tax=Actinomadura parmotrematis TaxID=2864039 RepID=A0ABS7G3V6_9ACTN|nr:DUF397 domain-containing protein [Actinomadura parmotrematis]
MPLPPGPGSPSGSRGRPAAAELRRKGSRSGQNGNRAEVARVACAAAVRDGKDAGAAPLLPTVNQWRRRFGVA